MGKYTEHWATYTRDTNRRTLRLLGVLALIPLVAAMGYWLSGVTSWSVHITVALLIAWLVLFAVLARGGARVPCPRCATVYSRGRTLVNCPRCGLRMLQEDPT
jgi:cobalamin biosynthesis protein CobD/CbiB